MGQKDHLRVSIVSPQFHKQTKCNPLPEHGIRMEAKHPLKMFSLSSSSDAPQKHSFQIQPQNTEKNERLNIRKWKLTFAFIPRTGFLLLLLLPHKTTSRMLSAQTFRMASESVAELLLWSGIAPLKVQMKAMSEHFFSPSHSSAFNWSSKALDSCSSGCCLAVN